jgi:hypothetical protein
MSDVQIYMVNLLAEHFPWLWNGEDFDHDRVIDDLNRLFGSIGGPTYSDWKSGKWTPPTQLFQDPLAEEESQDPPSPWEIAREQRMAAADYYFDKRGDR